MNLLRYPSYTNGIVTSSKTLNQCDSNRFCMQCFKKKNRFSLLCSWPKSIFHSRCNEVKIDFALCFCMLWISILCYIVLDWESILTWVVQKGRIDFQCCCILHIIDFVSLLVVQNRFSCSYTQAIIDSLVCGVKIDFQVDWIQESIIFFFCLCWNEFLLLFFLWSLKCF